ncbi:MAG: arsinothricin resistance N-acetyltransferase ArsN1 family B [Parasphingopyxis sp.]|nr:N-acetyltransferase family protein [Sphingomonadales bacterium]
MIPVRAATADDAEACRAIYAPYVEESWISFEEEAPSAREMKRRIAGYGASHGWVVAEEEGAVVGYAYGSPHRLRHAYRFSCDVAIYIDRARAAQGIGRAIYGALLPLLASRGMHAAYAGIALPNEASIRLHESVGFERIGVYREVGYKLGGWRDVGWWQKLLES